MGGRAEDRCAVRVSIGQEVCLYRVPMFDCTCVHVLTAFSCVSFAFLNCRLFIVSRGRVFIAVHGALAHLNALILIRASGGSAEMWNSRIGGEWRPHARVFSLGGCLHPMLQASEPSSVHGWPVLPGGWCAGGAPLSLGIQACCWPRFRAFLGL